MKMNLPPPSSQHRILEQAILGLLVIISVPTVAVSFYAQGQVMDRLETPIVSSLADVVTASTGTSVPNPDGQPQASVKSGDHLAPSGLRFERPSE